MTCGVPVHYVVDDVDDVVSTETLYVVGDAASVGALCICCYNLGPCLGALGVSRDGAFEVVALATDGLDGAHEARAVFARARDRIAGAAYTRPLFSST